MGQGLHIQFLVSKNYPGEQIFLVYYLILINFIKKFKYILFTYAGKIELQLPKKLLLNVHLNLSQTLV